MNQSVTTTVEIALALKMVEIQLFYDVLIINIIPAGRVKNLNWPHMALRP